MYSAVCHHATARPLFVIPLHLNTFSEAVSLARLVKAEIVSPYSRILINTGVGNLPRHLLRRLGDKRVLLGWWGLVVSAAHIRG